MHETSWGGTTPCFLPNFLSPHAYLDSDASNAFDTAPLLKNSQFSSSENEIWGPMQVEKKMKKIEKNAEKCTFGADSVFGDETSVAYGLDPQFHTVSATNFSNQRF